ncbi:MAG TPA: DUF6600 domain-containing protein [Verrucomicrobiae bacterium]|nr:DUF6600 domain-containing protein [Verrucomicrobiae bacterium]
MKIYFLLIGLLVCLGWNTNGAALNPPVSGMTQVRTKADFEAPLARYGEWVDAGEYGRGWHPTGLAAKWRPYCNGRWVSTECGWFWASQEPWAWACYHYGTWSFDTTHGWVWVPGLDWAPAWVNWREGGNFIGWAPCLPSGGTLAPAEFVFIDIQHFLEPIQLAGVIVNNTAVVNQTKEIGGLARAKRTLDGSSTAQVVIVNQGPTLEMIQKVTGKDIQVVPIREIATAEQTSSVAPTTIVQPLPTPPPPVQTTVPPAAANQANPTPPPAPPVPTVPPPKP